MTLFLVVLGAMLGAPARYLLDRAIQGRIDSVFPWGILAVNAAGSFLLGLIASCATASLAAFFGAGFCGAFTTYSTFAYETLLLARNGYRFRAGLNVLANVAAGLAAVYVGVLAAQALT